MANKNIIDMQGLYRAGYASAIDPENRDKDYRVQLIDKLFLKAGGWIIDRYQRNHEELKGLKQLGRASNSQIQMEVQKLGGQLNPKMQASLDLYKAEYDKGARMSVRGLTKKKKNEGQIMMDMAFHKMQTMKSGLAVVQEKMKEMVDNGMIELGENPFNGTAVTGWNSGATEEEFNNAVRLATGEMLGNLSIDDETGEIYYMSQAMADTSEEAYNSAMNELSGEGVEDNQLPTFEDWASQQEDGEMEATLFSRVKFPVDEDNSLQDAYKTTRNTAEQQGLDGFEIDEESSQKLKMEFSDSYANATDRQIRSFLFGGQVTMVNDEGKLTRVTPAAKLLIDSGINPGNANGTEEEQKQYLRFQLALENLKSEDFSKGSPRREELVDMVTNSVEGYQSNAYNKYLKREAAANKRKTRSGGGDSSKTGSGKIQIRTGVRFTKDVVDKKIEGMKSIVNEGKTGDIWVDYDQRQWIWDKEIGKFKFDTGEVNEDGESMFMERDPNGLIELVMPTAVGYHGTFSGNKMDALNITKVAEQIDIPDTKGKKDPRAKYSDAMKKVIPKKFQVTIDGAVFDVRKINPKQFEKLSMNDRLKYFESQL